MGAPDWAAHRWSAATPIVGKVVGVCAGAHLQGNVWAIIDAIAPIFMYSLESRMGFGAHLCLPQPIAISLCLES